MDTSTAEVVEIEDAKPRLKHSFWADELASSDKLLSNWHKRGTKIVRRYLDERDDSALGDKVFRLNLFHANVTTIFDMLYSNLPKVEASRTNADSGDDVARVAAEIAERIINLDVAQNGQEYDTILRSCLQDRLLPGLGCARVRYDAQFEEVEIAEERDEAGNVIAKARTEKRLVSEDSPVEYYHWQDVRWGWGRSFSELPWIAFRAYLPKYKAAERFGEDIANKLQYRKQKVADTKDSEWGNSDDDSPWSRAEIWEIWDKVKRRVLWYSPGAEQLLDAKPDTLKLEQFFPCPPFLIANVTTTLYRPTPDFIIAQDLYNSIDELQTRIDLITSAVKVVGVYDAQCEGVQRMLSEAMENDLIPVDEWSMFAESGGIKGKIDWLPLADIVSALTELQKIRDEQIRMLQMITGMADVMQGQLQSPYEGVGQSQIKAQFGSVRVQALQDQFAQFASDLMQLKLEVICKHYEPETIAQLANMQFSNDPELVPQAVQLLKQPDMARVRIKVRPETVAMVDYARLKVERTEFLTAMATFMQSAAPLLEQDPNSMPYLIKMLQWSMAGFKGSQEIEGILDKAADASVQRLQQQAGQPQEDPQQQTEKMKAEAQLQAIQAKAQADMQLRQQDMQADIQTVLATHEAKMREIQANHIARVTEIKMKLQAQMMLEQAKLEANVQQTEATAQAETMKDIADTKLDIMGEMAKAEIEIDKEQEHSLTEINKLILQQEVEPDEPDADSDD